MVKQGNAAGSTDIRLALILVFKVIFQILFCSVVETFFFITHSILDVPVLVVLTSRYL